MNTDLWGNERQRRRHDGPSAIVHVPSGRCPGCGEATRSRTTEQGALFRHGGFGATERQVVRSCRCGWSIVAETSEIRPDVAYKAQPDGEAS